MAHFFAVTIILNFEGSGRRRKASYRSIIMQNSCLAGQYGFIIRDYISPCGSFKVIVLQDMFFFRFHSSHPFRNCIHENLKWALHIDKSGRGEIGQLNPFLNPPPPPPRGYECSDKKYIYLPVGQDERSNIYLFQPVGLRVFNSIGKKYQFTSFEAASL